MLCAICHSGESRRSDIPVTSNTSVVTGIYGLSDRRDLQAHNVQDRQSNIDVNKPIDQLPWQYKQFVSSAKPNTLVVPIASQQIIPSEENVGFSQQQSSSYKEPLNIEASQRSTVSSDPKQKSSDNTTVTNTTIGMFNLL